MLFHFNRFDCQKSHVLVIIATVCIFALILGLGIGLSYRNTKDLITDEKIDTIPVVNVSDNVTLTSPKSVILTSSKSVKIESEKTPSNGGTYLKAAVASDGKPCAKIGA